MEEQCMDSVRRTSTCLLCLQVSASSWILDVFCFYRWKTKQPPWMWMWSDFHLILVNTCVAKTSTFPNNLRKTPHEHAVSLRCQSRRSGQSQHPVWHWNAIITGMFSRVWDVQAAKRGESTMAVSSRACHCVGFDWHMLGRITGAGVDGGLPWDSQPPGSRHPWKLGQTWVWLCPEPFCPSFGPSARASGEEDGASGASGDGQIPTSTSAEPHWQNQNHCRIFKGRVLKKILPPCWGDITTPLVISGGYSCLIGVVKGLNKDNPCRLWLLLFS